MPAASDFGDGTTIIEGPTPSTAHALGAHVPPGGSTGRGKGVETSPTKSYGYREQTTFARTSDYFSEERPFVVRIGKKGVIGALQELDEHLHNVRLHRMKIRVFFSRSRSHLSHSCSSSAPLTTTKNFLCWVAAGGI